MAQITPKVYSATATSFVTAVPAPNKGATYESAQFAVSRAKSYTLLLESPEVLSGVVGELKLHLTLEQLARQLKAENPTDTLLINVTAQADSPNLAKRIADSASRHLAAEIEALETAGSSERTSPVDIQLAVPAPTPASPVSPRPIVNVILGTLLGFAVAALAALYAASRRHHRRKKIVQASTTENDPWWQNARHVRDSSGIDIGAFGLADPDSAAPDVTSASRSPAPSKREFTESTGPRTVPLTLGPANESTEWSPRPPAGTTPRLPQPGHGGFPTGSESAKPFQRPTAKPSSPAKSVPTAKPSSPTKPVPTAKPSSPTKSDRGSVTKPLIGPTTRPVPLPPLDPTAPARGRPDSSKTKNGTPQPAIKKEQPINHKEQTEKQPQP